MLYFAVIMKGWTRWKMHINTESGLLLFLCGLISKGSARLEYPERTFSDWFGKLFDETRWLDFGGNQTLTHRQQVWYLRWFTQKRTIREKLFKDIDIWALRESKDIESRIVMRLIRNLFVSLCIYHTINIISVINSISKDGRKSIEY